MRRLLEAAHYDVTYSDEGAALDVFARLFRQPYRVLVIAAHGSSSSWPPMAGRAPGGAVGRHAAHRGRGPPDGSGARTGVSQLLPPRRHERNAGDREPAGLQPSRELIEMGVRCVVAAGWQVNDDAARCFAETFFGEFVSNNTPFGSAVHEARKAIWERWPQCNTWGAYQVYGDPITGSSLAPAAAAGARRCRFRWPN